MEILNRKARYDYEIEDTYEAGIVLTGTEIKSIRMGKVNIKDSYAIIRNNEIYLLNTHISLYEEGNRFNHDEDRTRKLLLHKKEILKLKDILINKTNHIKKIYNINNDNIIYEFTFYDKYDAEISSLSMDNKNRVIINRQYVLNNKDIKAYIIELIDKYDNKTHT